MLHQRQLFIASPKTFQVLCRYGSSTRSISRSVPPPTPFIPDVSTFLKVIGRGLHQHTAKITSWDALFKLSSSQFRDIGIEPPRARRYLLWWREKFRRGDYGIGGDLLEVQDGVGEMRVFEVASRRPAATPATITTSEGMRKVAINVPIGSKTPRVPLSEAKPVKRVRIKHDHTICGPHVQPVAGSDGHVAKIVALEGIWEERRGHKVDGGERRKAEVRAKRRALERKAAEK